MSLEFLLNIICDLALKRNLVNYAASGPSIYALNNLTVDSYPFIFVSPTENITTRRNFTDYTLTFFYVERLLADMSNETHIFSIANDTIVNLCRQLKQLEGIIAVSEPNVRLFTETERMADRCAGGFSNVTITVLNDAECPVWMDEEGDFMGTYVPQTLQDLDVLDSLASKTWVLRQIVGASISGITADELDALFDEYTKTKDFAKINGSGITSGQSYNLVEKNEFETFYSAYTQEVEDIYGAISAATPQGYEENVAKIEKNADDIAVLSGQTSANTVNIAALSASTQGIEGTVHANTDSIEALSSTTASLSATTASLSGQTSAITQNVSSLTQDLAVLSASTAQGLSGLSSDIETLSAGTSDALSAISASISAATSGMATEQYVDNAIADIDDWVVTLSGYTQYWDTDVEAINALIDKANSMTGSTNPAYDCQYAKLRVFIHAGRERIGEWMEFHPYALTPDSISLYSVFYDESYAGDDRIVAWYGTLYRGTSIPQGGFKEVVVNPAELTALISGKQDALTAGDNITIQNNVISAAGNVSSTTVLTLWSGTQAAYDAITNKDANTLYIITDVSA